MHYKPKFCCNCGEKVERRDWKPWTSTRFCEVCENDLKFRDWFPRAVVFVGLLAGVFGFGSYLRTNEKPINISRNVRTANGSAKQIAPPGPDGPVSRGLRTESSNSNSGDNKDRSPEPANRPGLMEIEQNSEAGTVYFCGARTKKGKPCSRLVKGGGRCWQHPGKVAMFPQEKLLAPN